MANGCGRPAASQARTAEIDVGIVSGPGAGARCVMMQTRVNRRPPPANEHGRRSTAHRLRTFS